MNRYQKRIETVLTKNEHNVVHCPSSQFISRRRKFGGGESPPGSSSSLQDFSRVHSGQRSEWAVGTTSDQQDLDHEYERLILI